MNHTKGPWEAEFEAWWHDSGYANKDCSRRTAAEAAFMEMVDRGDAANGSEPYGVKSLRLIRAAVKRGMHLDGTRLYLPTGKLHVGTPQNGRDRVNLSIGGERCTIQTARIVCYLAHGEPPNDRLVVDHINGDTFDDRPENLRWSDYSQNMRNNPVTRKHEWEQRCADGCDEAGIMAPDELTTLVATCEAVNQALTIHGLLGFANDLAEALCKVRGATADCS